MNIPNIIHLIFLSKTEKIPDTFQRCIENIKARCEDWEVRIYNEDDANSVLEEYMPYILQFYNSLDLNVQKADLLRIIVVYIFGGFYMDMDMLCLKDLKELRQYPIVLAEEKTISKEEKVDKGLRHRLRIANYMFGSIPGHIFWLYVISDMLLATKHTETDNDILESTGPGLLTKTFHRSKTMLPDLLVLRNLDRRCLHPNHNAISCHFGNFASHLHKGTWREKVIMTSSNGITEQEQKELTNLFLSKIDGSSKDFLSNVCVHISKEAKRSPHLLDLYNKLSTCIRTIDENQEDVHNKIVLTLCCYPGPGIQRRISNLYILLFIDVPGNIPEHIISKIKLSYDLIIVTSEHIKNTLIKKGVNVQVEVISLGFKRYKREFSSLTNPLIENENFNIGATFFSLTQNNIISLIEYFKNIKRKTIPELKLCIWQERQNQFRNKLLLRTLVTNSDWIEVVSKNKQKWFNDLHYFLSFTKSKDTNLESLTCLYLGIPTIVFGNESCIPSELQNYIIQNSNSKALTQSKFEGVIETGYENYPLYASKAIEGSQIIQDKYSIEETYIKLITLIKKVKCHISFSI